MVTIKKITKQELEKQDVFSWLIWENEISKYDWDIKKAIRKHYYFN